MTVGNIVQLEARGPEDYSLYGNPNSSAFKSVYSRSTNFAIDYYKVSDNQLSSLDFGSKVYIKLPMTGDLLAGLYINIDFKDIVRTSDYLLVGSPDTNPRQPRFTSYINGIGVYIIDEVRFLIGGKEIEKINGEAIFLYNQLHEQNSKELQYDLWSYYTSGFSIGNTNTTGVKTTLSIPFFFSRKSHNYLPICSLRNSELVVEIKFKPLNKCLVKKFNSSDVSGAIGINGTDGSSDPTPSVVSPYAIYDEGVIAGINKVEVISKIVYLDKVEKQLFVTKELSYLIETINIGNADTLVESTANKSYFFPLNFYNPTKYIFWVLQRKDVEEANMVDNYNYDFSIRYGSGNYSLNNSYHLLDESNLMINNVKLTTLDNGVFISKVQLLETFNTYVDTNIYCFSFSLDPNNDVLKGSLNFSKLLNKSLYLTLVNSSKYSYNNTTPNIVLRSYSVSYNMLQIRDGLGGLVFNN